MHPLYRGKQCEAALHIAAISDLVEDKCRHHPGLCWEPADALFTAPFLKKTKAVPYVNG